MRGQRFHSGGLFYANEDRGVMGGTDCGCAAPAARVAPYQRNEEISSSTFTSAAAAAAALTGGGEEVPSRERALKSSCNGDGANLVI